jgi:hypothetical protein
MQALTVAAENRENRENRELLQLMQQYLAAIRNAPTPFEATERRYELMQFLEHLASLDNKNRLAPGPLQHMRMLLTEVLVCADVTWSVEEKRKVFRAGLNSFPHLWKFCDHNDAALEARKRLVMASFPKNEVSSPSNEGHSIWLPTPKPERALEMAG